jgi:hypothetical protein
MLAHFYLLSQLAHLFYVGPVFAHFHFLYVGLVPAHFN